jgi:hypothetical protein
MPNLRCRSVLLLVSLGLDSDAKIRQDFAGLGLGSPSRQDGGSGHGCYSWLLAGSESLLATYQPVSSSPICSSAISWPSR